jgi:hypothetical protein
MLNDVSPTPSDPIDPKLIVDAVPAIASAAKWFWWIAGLSLVNTALIHGGSDTSFAVGLGFTLLADVLFREVAAVAFVIDAVAIGFFVAMGYFALRGKRWAFILGGIIYLLDATIFLFLKDLLSLGFHGLALFYLFNGFRTLNEAIRTASSEPTPPDLEPSPSLNPPA